MSELWHGLERYYWKKIYNEKIRNLYLSPIIIRVINEAEWDEQGMYHAWRNDKYIHKFVWQTWREEPRLGDAGVRGNVALT
jgi:hypothetical protein